ERKRPHRADPLVRGTADQIEGADTDTAIALRVVREIRAPKRDERVGEEREERAEREAARDETRREREVVEPFRHGVRDGATERGCLIASRHDDRKPRQGHAPVQRRELWDRAAMSNEDREWHDRSDENERVENGKQQRRSHQVKLAQPSQYSHRWGRCHPEFPRSRPPRSPRAVRSGRSRAGASSLASWA